MIQVGITDDHPATIIGVKSILEQTENISVWATFTCGKDLLQGLRHQIPDVLLLDVHLPDLTGNKLARIISERYPEIAILAFSNMSSDFHITDMLRNGCLGYLFKTADAATIVRAIREVHDGRKFIEQPLKAAVEDEIRQINKQVKTLPPLTKRENEVLQLICSGKSNQQIAQLLFISIRTVESHRFNLQQKLKAGNTVELVNLALRAGLTK